MFKSFSWGDEEVDLLVKIAQALEQVKEQKPLVHHITNYVTVNDCANITLALGASPVMADDKDEVEEMVSFAKALVLNIGTLNSRSIESMLLAGKKAKKLGIPVVLDPVGVGATKLRTETARRIIEEVRPTIIRGNMSEVKILAGLQVAIKGVDSVADEEDSQTIAKNLANQLQCVVAITGKQDVVTDGTRLCLINNGHEMLSRVTGTGCMTTSLIGSYSAVLEDPWLGAIAGIVSMGLAGERAQSLLKSHEGLGSFRVKLFDSISTMSGESLRTGGQVIYE